MPKTQKKSPLGMPVLVMRGMVLFPRMILHFDVGREKSIFALDAAMEKDRTIFLVSQKDVVYTDPNKNEIYTVGVVAEIKQIIKSNDYLRVLVEGKFRAKVSAYNGFDPYIEADVLEFPMSKAKESNANMTMALVRTLKDLFEEYGMRAPRMSKELVFGATAIEEPLYLTDYVASNLPISFKEKQKILEESNISKRLTELIKILEEENTILSLEQEIQEKVRGQIDSNQREFYLREQLKVISAELGDSDPIVNQIDDYRQKIKKFEFSEETAEKLLKEIDRLEKLPSNSHEAGVITGWLDSVFDLPWGESTQDTVNVKSAQKQLDQDHYGMKKVKERILEMIAVRQLAPEQKGQIICLVGPPGVGKTSIGRSVAKAMNRNYVRISLGGVRDESDIRGHRKTYIGAMPGRIMTGIEQAGSNNPLMLLDEVDKMGNDFRGDPSSAMLEVLDSEQNHAFRDHYIEVPFDLSEVLFFATANDLSTIPQPLFDRMEIIHIGSYTREEKYEIAKRHLIPKQLKKHGLTSEMLNILKSGIYAIIDNYTREAGVRSLEREIASLCRKCAKQIVAGETKKITLSDKNIEKYLGIFKFKNDDFEKTSEIGLVNGLAWTSVGGELLQLETAILDGTGKIVLTGSLGDVMKESAHTAISYVRSCAAQYNIDPDFYKNKDIHLHAPEGAVPKDGPSAGIAMVTALVSALSGIPIRSDVAMTGEVSLRGRVLPIGGLREKSMAAYRNIISTVIIPEANLSDLEEVDDVVKKKIKFIPVKDVSQVLEIALDNKKNNKKQG